MRSPGYLDTFSSATPLGQESEVAEKVYLEGKRAALSQLQVFDAGSWSAVHWPSAAWSDAMRLRA